MSQKRMSKLYNGARVKKPERKGYETMEGGSSLQTRRVEGVWKVSETNTIFNRI